MKKMILLLVIIAVLMMITGCEKEPIMGLEGVWVVSEQQQGDSEWINFPSYPETTITFTGELFKTTNLFGACIGIFTVERGSIIFSGNGFHQTFLIEESTPSAIQVRVEGMEQRFRLVKQ